MFWRTKQYLFKEVEKHVDCHIRRDHAPAAPDREVLFQTNNLVATFGGAEANVAVSLANYGENVSYVTAAPANPVGDAIVKEMRSFGIDTKFILRKGERLGILH